MQSKGNMEEIKRLVEQRQIESLKKQLPTKMLCILKILGSNVYSDSGYGTGINTNEYDDEFFGDEETNDGNEIKEIPDEDYSDIGWTYTYLKFGTNIEIRYLIHDKELKTTYNGYTVYLEIDGQLKSYVPSPLWEESIDALYLIAKPKEDENKKEEKVNS